MHFEQSYLSCLAHASYMLGSEGVAAVVDPQPAWVFVFRRHRKTG